MLPDQVIDRFSATHPATVDREDGTLNIGGGITAEEHQGSGEILRSPPASGRDAGQDRVVAGLVGT